MRKAKRYLIGYDPDGNVVVWFQYADFTVQLSALGHFDIEDDSEIPIIDLRKTLDE